MHTLPRPSELLNIRTGWDREDYFADEALNFHSLWDFGRDPKLFSQGFFDVQETTDAMRMGTQLHTLVLEGEEKFNKENVLWSPPINDKTGKPFGDPRPRGARWYVPVTLIAAEKKPPFRVAVLQPDEETQSGARERIGDLLEQYIEAVESGNYEPRYDEIITLHRS